ncbi:MAG TPA: 4-phosphoerythronate dehydrogenase [Kiritimatiellia bacterium]|nr:4-phosphoerythronate dehydrogenase [Kiritimatiellia bacterium]HQQ05038.1 4-phosphoerythronate dehydrogenase [Kiritimatiellia bacterium]
MIKTVCASSVAQGAAAFAQFGPVEIIPDSEITPQAVSSATALVVRSKTKVGPDLLKGSRVRFVGTATAGFDHFDRAWLDHAGIVSASAPGCNANSVAEYVMAALLCIAAEKRLDLDEMTLGVVGCGNIGSRVARRAEVIGIRVLKNDPPLAAETGNPDFIPLEHLLKESDIVTLHVPLTTGGPWPTAGLAACPFFSQIKPGAVFINTSRGEVVDESALTLSLQNDAVSAAVLDVWRNEPVFSRTLLDLADIGSPHIAGYSAQGLLNGTMAVYQELCHFLEEPPAWKPEPAAAPLPPVEMDTRGLSHEEVLHQMSRSVYDIRADDTLLRRAAAADDETRGRNFTLLRSGYPVRHEFADARIRLLHADRILTEKAKGLGFCNNPC